MVPESLSFCQNSPVVAHCDHCVPSCCCAFELEVQLNPRYSALRFKTPSGRVSALREKENWRVELRKRCLQCASCLRLSWEDFPFILNLHKGHLSGVQAF
jgi:hypothetical protein